MTNNYNANDLLTLPSLPSDLLIYLKNFLNNTEFLKIRQVCKTLKEALNTNNYWTEFKHRLAINHKITLQPKLKINNESTSETYEEYFNRNKGSYERIKQGLKRECYIPEITQQKELEFLKEAVSNGYDVVVENYFKDTMFDHIENNIICKLLEIAHEKNQPDCFAAILKRAITYNGSEILYNNSLTANYCFTLLITAVKDRQFAFIKILKENFNLILKTFKGREALSEATEQAKKNDFKSLSCLLMGDENFISTKENINKTNYDNSTLLHFAINLRAPDLVLFLLDCGSNPTIKSWLFDTPLALAKTTGNNTIILAVKKAVDDYQTKGSSVGADNKIEARRLSQ